ncbi:type III-A CRISPR-associated protein Csm2 [Rudanella lutea]|uniref:type III-A CRISPR-associated protein Csm2 n=1 Tax=Rudanella lutea TaxID=451374 RepID=UPI00146EE067|nr:type III-A CRISPR-associated protein Csm2 [Rudanella lutea]
MAKTRPSNIDPAILKDGVRDVDVLKNWGHYLAEKDHEFDQLSSSQLRRFFGAVKKIQADFKGKRSELPLLEPKLAYAVGRDFNKDKQKNKSKIKPFYELMCPLIRGLKSDKQKPDEIEIDERKRFKHFVDVFEGIVAYHKEMEEVKTQPTA